jgi:hypothetical protein
MTVARCPKCNSRKIAEAKDGGRTEQGCLRCDAVAPLKTDGVKWAGSSLGQPPRA